MAEYSRELTHSSPAGTRQKRERAICRAARITDAALALSFAPLPPPMRAPRLARPSDAPPLPSAPRERSTARCVHGGSLANGASARNVEPPRFRRNELCDTRDRALALSATG